MTAFDGAARAAAPAEARPKGLRARWQRARHSLGARVVALFLLLALALAVTFLAGTQAALRFGWNDYARPLVADYADALAAQIGTPPDIDKARALTERLPLRIRISGPVVNWSSSSPLDASRDDGGGSDGWRRPGRPERDRDRASTWRPTRVLADGHRISFGLRDANRQEAADDEPHRIGWITLGVLLLLTALAYGMVRHWLRPLKDIRAGALRYGAGDFSVPIGHRRQHGELGDLAGQIDRMAAGLQHLLDAKRQLLLAISHELRSPLTRARLHAELVEEGESRTALLRDLAEMRDLIADLLESERLHSGHAQLATEPTDLNTLLSELVAARSGGEPADNDAAAPPPGPPVRLDLAAGPLVLPLDRSRIRLLVRNLLDNALRHSPPDGPPPSLATRRSGAGDDVMLTVRDHGPGVAEDQLPHLAEAFYRPDAARQRTTGGVGLGLYLCRLVAEAHGGRLTLRNARPGFEAEVILPPSGGARPADR